MSRKYVEQIKDITSELSGKILNLSPVSFKFKTDLEPKKINYGLIAEEVNNVLPEIVIYKENGDPEAVAYHILPIFLLNELKKQNKEIKKLRKELELWKLKIDLKK